MSIWVCNFCIYGVAAAFSAPMYRQNAELYVAMIAVALATFTPFRRQSHEFEEGVTQTGGVNWIFSLSYIRWISDAIYGIEAAHWDDIYDVQQAASTANFSYGQSWVPKLLYAFALGIFYRIIGALLMEASFRWHTSRSAAGMGYV